MTHNNKRITALQRRAEIGDPDAQISLAWEYFLGTSVPKDFVRATQLFKQAETEKPLLARFYLAKAKFLCGDESFANEILKDCDSGFGPSLYLMGMASREKPKGEFEAIKLFALAAQNNHLASEFLLWRLKPKSALLWLRTLPGAMTLLIKIIRVKTRDPHDLKVLT